MKTAEEIVEENFHVKGMDPEFTQRIIKSIKLFHSQFSIGGEAAAMQYILEGEREQYPDGFNTLVPDRIKAAFMAGTAYSSEGIRVREVLGKDLKEGDEIWVEGGQYLPNGRWYKIDEGDYLKIISGNSGAKFLVRLPSNTK